MVYINNLKFCNRVDFYNLGYFTRIHNAIGIFKGDLTIGIFMIFFTALFSF